MNAPVAVAAGASAGAPATDLAIGQFQDQAGAPLANYTTVISWGDATAPDPASGQFSETGTTVTLTGSHTFASWGVYDVSAVIDKHDGSDPITLETTIQVGDAPLTVLPQNFSTGANVPLTGQVVATFSDNPLESSADFTASIDWGDGTASGATITANADGTFNVVASHTYTDAGNFPVTVSVWDDDGDFVQSQETATVSGEIAATPVAVQGTENTPFSGTPVATFTSTDPNAAPGDFSVSIQWGDGQSGNGTVTQNADGSFTVAGSHSYAAGSYAPTITITAGDGSNAVITTDAEIADAPLAVQGLDGSVAVGDGTSSVQLASFTDADPAPMLANFSAVIDWGDEAIDGGSAPSQGTVVEQPDGSFVIQGTHAYAAAGTYTATVYITDSAGSYAWSTSTITVVPATPVITWNNPADISYGTPLGSTQLDAAANVPGFFVYTPAAGTVLNAGSGQTLSVTFTPSDTVNYTTARQTVLINVNAPAGTLASTVYLSASESPANLGDTITFSAIVSGSGTPTGNVTFVVDGVAIGTGTLDMMGDASVATSSLGAGNYTLTAIYSGDNAFASSTASSALTVNQGYAMLSSSSDGASAAAGQTFMLSASVVGMASGFVPTGTLTFTLIDSNNNQTVLGTQTLDASGNASLSTSIDTPGTYRVEIS